MFSKMKEWLELKCFLFWCPTLTNTSGGKIVKFEQFSKKYLNSNIFWLIEKNSLSQAEGKEKLSRNWCG